MGNIENWNKLINKYVKDFNRKGFYGNFTVNFCKGDIVNINICESIKNPNSI